ncbi:MAG: poly-gamma-glutamate system protein [Desulfobacterales bacterium]|nr:poly-gamma-glutamate system protein [Desulfobacterales bacterium]
MTPAAARTAHMRLILWAVLSGVVLWALEAGRIPAAGLLHDRKAQAAGRMAAATQAVAAERERRGIPIDADADPNRTGLIGPEHTPITTTLGHLPAKRTSTNPNMAGLVAHLLGRAGAAPGACAAVAFSGSFPALNIAVLSACAAMDVRPVAVSSIGASTYGATHPDFTWPDMERALFERHVFPWRSAAVAAGGVERTSPLFADEGLRLARAAMDRSGLPVLDENGERSLAADVERRRQLYVDGCGGLPAVFVNVGGSLAAIGNCRGVDRLQPGLVAPGSLEAGPDCGLVHRMAADGVPVIHLLNVLGLARDHGLPVDPVPLPGVPDGRVMTAGGYSRPSALAGLMAVLGLGWWAGRRRLHRTNEREY